MIKLKEAFQFPFADKFWARRILIGGILLPLPLISFFPIGYLMRHFKSYIKGYKVDKLPEWDDLPLMLSYGFFSSIIFLCYLVIPFILFALGYRWIKGGFGALFIAASFVIAVWFLSYFPMGLANYLDTGKIKSAFSKKEMYDKISKISKSYYQSYLLAILLFFLGGNSPFVLFFILLVLCELFGKTLAPVFTEKEIKEEVVN